MKVRALRKFRDKKSGKLRTFGEVFDVSKTRMEEINSTPYGVLVEGAKEIEEHKATEVEKTEVEKEG